ncbi:hypothetical protein BJ742DRAFT_880728 [Cladochytrium replicatum]|nr:hypothetical protein BJ742DRAFT_880728 [Cladochytrium replicatum]
MNLLCGCLFLFYVLGCSANPVPYNFVPIAGSRYRRSIWDSQTATTTYDIGVNPTTTPYSGQQGCCSGSETGARSIIPAQTAQVSRGSITFEIVPSSLPTQAAASPSVQVGRDQDDISDAQNGEMALGQANRTITVASSIGALILVGNGFYLCFFGQKRLDPTMFMAGFYSFGISGYLIIFAIRDRFEGGLGAHSDWVLLIPLTVFGILGGLIVRRFVLIGCLTLGAIGGFVAANYVMATGLGGITERPAHITLVIVAILAAGGFMFFFECFMVVICTAAIGAMSITLGLDLFARTGFLEVMDRVFRVATPPTIEMIPGPSWGMMASVVVFLVLGWAMQTRPTPAGAIPSAKPFVWFWPWGGGPVQPQTWMHIRQPAPPKPAPAPRLI